MVTIELVAKCDSCPAEEVKKIDYTVRSISIASTFLKDLRALGWQFHYDEGWKLALTICPGCVTRSAPVGRR